VKRTAAHSSTALRTDRDNDDDEQDEAEEEGQTVAAVIVLHRITT
jgi:hypothetical protein